MLVGTMEWLSALRRCSPWTKSKFVNLFSRNVQSKNGFPAALTELRFLYKTFSQQQDLPYRVVHEKHHVAGRKIFSASAGDHLFENRTWQARKQLRFIQRYAIVVCIVHDSSPASNYCLPPGTSVVQRMRD